MTTRQHLYKSGWCGQSGLHDHCRGHYAGADCRCHCHRPAPEPQVCGECGRPLDGTTP